jgi:hypothetical protein
MLHHLSAPIGRLIGDLLLALLARNPGRIDVKVLEEYPLAMACDAEAGGDGWSHSPSKL